MERPVAKSSPATEAKASEDVEVRTEVLDGEEKVEEEKRSARDSRNCEQSIIEAMMAKTTILNSDELKVSFVRDLYEAIYSQGVLTSSVLARLADACLSVRFDCDEDHIGRLQESFSSITGALLDGRVLQNHADCRLEGASVVSMAALESAANPKKKIVGRLARTLARVSLHEAFHNRGLPYCSGDEQRRAEFQGVVKRIVANYSPDTGEFIKWAVESKSEAVKELGLVCAVPEIVAEKGAESGRKILQELYPELLDFYESHVMTKF